MANNAHLFNVEFDLSAEKASEHIVKHFPQLAPVKLVYLGEGYDTVVYEMENGLAFRFAKRQERVKLLVLEAQFTRFLSGCLPLPVPNPLYVADSLDGGGAFIGYQKIEGVCPTRYSGHLSASALASEIGNFLSALHAVPLGEVERFGIGNGGRGLFPDGGLDRLREQAEYIAPKLDAGLSERLKRFMEGFEEPAYPEAPPGLIHADLSAVHFRIKPDGSGFSGILDFGDACLGHPMFDFTGVFAWFGGGFTREALRHYRGSVDESHLPWIKTKAASYGIIETWEAYQSGIHDDLRSGIRALEISL
jgi:aminoglycoside 2''-phosphotransferase